MLNASENAQIIYAILITNHKFIAQSQNDR